MITEKKVCYKFSANKDWWSSKLKPWMTELDIDLCLWLLFFLSVSTLLLKWFSHIISSTKSSHLCLAYINITSTRKSRCSVLQIRGESVQQENVYDAWCWISKTLLDILVGVSLVPHRSLRLCCVWCLTAVNHPRLDASQGGAEVARSRHDSGLHYKAATLFCLC